MMMLNSMPFCPFGIVAFVLFRFNFLFGSITGTSRIAVYISSNRPRKTQKSSTIEMNRKINTIANVNVLFKVSTISLNLFILLVAEWIWQGVELIATLHVWVTACVCVGLSLSPSLSLSLYVLRINIRFNFHISTVGSIGCFSTRKLCSLCP